MVRVLTGFTEGDAWSSVPSEHLRDNVPCRIEGYADLNALPWHDKVIKNSLRRNANSLVVIAVSFAGSDGVPRIARIILKGLSHFIYVEGSFDIVNTICRNVWSSKRPPPGDYKTQVSIEHVYKGRLSKCVDDAELRRRVQGDCYTKDKFLKISFKSLAAMTSCILKLKNNPGLKLYHVPPGIHRMYEESTTCHVAEPFYFCYDNNMRVGTVGFFKGLDVSHDGYYGMTLELDVGTGEFVSLTRGPLDPPLKLSEEEVAQYKLPPLSTLAYDIETDTLMPTTPGACINMVSLVFQLKKCMVIAVASPKLDVAKLSEKLEQFSESECAFVLVDTELCLLSLMAKVIRNWDPANTLSFNGTLFDNQYIKMRCEANSIREEDFCYSLFGPSIVAGFKSKEFFSSGKGTKQFVYFSDHRGSFDGCVYSSNVLRNQVNSLNHNLQFLGILKMSNVPYTEIANMRHNANDMVDLLWYCLADSVLLWCLDVGGVVGEILSCIGVSYAMFEEEFQNKKEDKLVLSNSTTISKLTFDNPLDAWKSVRAGLNMSQFYIARARASGLQKDSICLSGEVAPVKGVLLLTAHDEDFIWDTPFVQGIEENSYAGGEVQPSCTSLFAPEAHLLNGQSEPEKIPLSVLTVDYTSMYPMIIKLEGMCFICSDGIRRKLSYGPDRQDDLTKHAKNMFLPRVVNRLLSGRQTCKNHMAVFEAKGILEGANSPAWVLFKYWTIMSNAMKVLCNSLYGALGSRFLGDTGIAENVTSVGRDNITRIAKLVPRITGSDIIVKYPEYCPENLHAAIKQLELSIVYGDTDSVLVLMRGPSVLSFTWSCFVGRRIAVEIKEWSLFYDPGRLPPQGDMDIENYAAAFFGMAPKVYAMLEDASMDYHIQHSTELVPNPKPMFKMKYRGFSGVRGNSLPLGSLLARRCVQAILYCAVPFAPMPKEIRDVWGAGPSTLMDGMKSELLKAFHAIHSLASATSADIPECAQYIVDGNLLTYKTMLKKTDNPGVPHRIQKMVCTEMQKGKLVQGYTAPPNYGDRVTFAYVESPNGKGFLQPNPIPDKSSCAFPSHEFQPNGHRRYGFNLNAIAVIGCVSPLFQALTGKTENVTKRELCDLWNSRGMKPLFGASGSVSLIPRCGDEKDESRKRRAKDGSVKSKKNAKMSNVKTLADFWKK